MNLLNVTFYQFSKRTNSTAQPASGSGTALSCQLKEECDMITPVLIIRNVPTGWNYAYIPAFRRYYFINSWRWKNGVWECDLYCDVLASFKTDIGSMSEYILRSSYEYNGQIVDVQYPTTAETRVNATMINTIFQSVFPGGYYVIGIISNDSSAAQGAVTYYQMTSEQLAALKAYMMSDTFLTEQDLNIQTVTDVIPAEILKTLYDPFKYIASCVWIPLPASDYLSSLKTLDNHIKFGWYTPQTALSGYKLNKNGYVKTYSERYAVYGHPQRFGRGVFLDHTPYADRMLFYPPFGSIPINDDSIIGGDSIRVEISVDMIMGDGVLSVYHDRPIDDQGSYDYMGLIARVSAPLAVPIQLAQTSVDVNGSVAAIETGAITGTVKAFAGAAAKNDLSVGGFINTVKDTLTGAVNSTFSAIGDVLANPVGQLQTSGTNGSLAQYSVHPYFVQKWKIVANDDNAQKGRPLCDIRTISTIPGFIMVDTPDVRLACMEAERQQIIAFMAGGFFYE